MSLCYFTRTFSVLHHRTVWARERSSDCWNRIVNGTWTVNDWRENFLMCPETFNHTRFRRAVPLPHRIVVTLWRLATDVEYRTISQLIGIGGSTAWEIVHDVSRKIVRILMPRYIQIPECQYLNEVIEGFQRKHRFHQIGGAIDGCHIPIVAPQVHRADYHNRKGFYCVLL